jgi:TolB-like protein/tRNA A-37 threonylcarbamoyl transferase component Bud32/Flp pilus assembly protein TadD
MIGKTISHYKILEKLGEGGMGVVYKAEDLKLKRTVALKFLPPELTRDPEAKERFIQEAQAASALDHPNICNIHEIDETEDGQMFIVMACYEGETLKKKVASGQLSVDSVIDIAIQIAQGLAKAHEHGIIHRDIKPANVMITNDGVAKILDFGLAKLAGQVGLTKTGVTLGTIAYMSPEQARGEEVDARTDIWSFGVVMYDMLTGRLPFRGEYEAAIAYSILTEEPDPITGLRTGVPMELERIVNKTLLKKPEERYQHVDELMVDLTALQKKLATPRTTADAVAKPKSTVPSPKRQPAPARQKIWLIAAVSVLVALTALVALLLNRGGEKGVPGAKKMLVVLPFENLGPPEDEYFAAGMTEEITSRLAAVSGLGVISRTSAVHYAGTDKTVKQIGKELGVEYVLEGTVRWAREPAGVHRVRITPQLIRVSDDTHLWAEPYDRVINDIFEVQSEIAQRVVKELGVALLALERKALTIRPTKNLEAYQAYLRGRYYAGRPHFSLQIWEKMVESYQEAVELDPDFALAYAELSKAHARFYYFRYDISEERRTLAKRAVNRAAELAPDSPETHSALGYYYFWVYRDAERALEEFENATVGRPEGAEILLAKAELLRMQGRMQEAAEHYKRAFELSPRDAESILELGLTYWWSRKYPDALQAINQAAVLAPDDAWPYLARAFNYWSWKGALQLHEARLALESVPKDHEWAPWAWFWQEIFDGRYREAIDRLSSTPGQWIRLKVWAFPKSLLSAFAHELLNEAELARKDWQIAKSMLEGEVRQLPEDARYHGSLGIAYAALNQKEDAIGEGRRAVELLPVTKDAIYGLGHTEDLAFIYTLVGEHDTALDQLEQLLSIPGWISVPWLQMDPRWDGLRKHPRFQRLLKKYSGDKP